MSRTLEVSRGKKILNALIGAYFQFFNAKVFDPHKIFLNKRIAIVGPGSTAYDQFNGNYIDDFDFVIRFNRSPSLLGKENRDYIGSKTDIVFHSLFDNAYPEFLFKKELNVKYIIHPRNNLRGKRQRFNFFKKYKVNKRIYTLNKKIWLELDHSLGNINPTMGFCGLYSVLTSNFKECFITGFSFYSTGYEKGYEDSFIPGEHYFNFLKSYISPHDPRLEKEIVFKLIKSRKDKDIKLDNYLEKEFDKIIMS